MKYGLFSNIYDYAEDIKTCVSSITSYWPGYKEILLRITDNARKIQTYTESADEKYNREENNDA